MPPVGTDAPGSEVPSTFKNQTCIGACLQCSSKFLFHCKLSTPNGLWPTMCASCHACVIGVWYPVTVLLVFHWTLRVSRVFQGLLDLPEWMEWEDPKVWFGNTAASHQSPSPGCWWHCEQAPFAWKAKQNQTNCNTQGFFLVSSG